MSVQTGRLLSGGGPVTWLVDRYRREILIPVPGGTELELFEDLPDAGEGELTLAITCAVE